MSYGVLIEPTEAATGLSQADWLYVDCRFDLADPDAGHRAYKRSHIPGSIYVDLDKDLSGAVIPGKTGRHPLPEPEQVIRLFSLLGIETNTQVVAYDDSTGAMAAARLWWLLKWSGHEAVAVLNGGLRAWIASGFDVSNAETPPRNPSNFVGQFRSDLIVDASTIRTRLGSAQLLVDSRTPERYSGDFEPIDPVGGHIPGAVCRPYTQNLNPDGTFQSPEKLAGRFRDVAAEDSDLIFYCGSGVTAAHNLLAFAAAFGELPKLFPGSWSEWITDPDNPIVRGQARESIS